MRRKQEEKTLSQQISDYLSIKYPKVLFRFDVGSDVKLSIIQASKFSKLQGRWSKGFTDLVIYKSNSRYCGLCIELKAEGKSPFKKDGSLKKDKHLESQNAMHELLRKENYYATFSTGYNETIKIIDDYLSIK